MIEFEQIIKEVSERVGIDKETVKKICQHPFLFTVDVMKDKNDYHDILFSKLFRFSLKGRFKNNKTKPYSPKYENDEKHC